jgi:hypothetical protein
MRFLKLFSFCDIQHLAAARPELQFMLGPCQTDAYTNLVDVRPNPCAQN